MTSYKEEEAFDGLFISLASGLFLGRLVYVLLNFGKFGFSIFKFILVNGYPGFSIWGVMLGGFAGFMVYCTVKKIKFIEFIDYYMTSIFIAVGFGKIGSFFSGAEAGEKTNFFMKIKYFGLQGYRHLTPLYEGILFIAASVIIQKILLEIRKDKFFHGFLFYFGLWYFSAVYFLFDNIKSNHLYFLGYSFNKAVSITLLLTISIYFIYYFRGDILSFIKLYGEKIIKKVPHRTKKQT